MKKPYVPVRQRIQESYTKGFDEGRQSMEVYVQQTQNTIEFTRKIALIDARTKAINASGQAMQAVAEAMKSTITSC